MRSSILCYLATVLLLWSMVCGMTFGFQWEVMYDADVMPDLADPAWQAIGTQQVRTSNVESDILSIQTQGDGWEGWAINAGPNWDGEEYLTVEFRMRQTGVSRLEIGKSNRQWSLVFTDNTIESRFGSDAIAVDTTQWRTYRITKTPGSPEDTVQLYIDDNPVATELEIEHAGTYDFNLIRVMKMADAGTTEIDYIYYNSSIAVAPGQTSQCLVVDDVDWQVCYNAIVMPDVTYPSWSTVGTQSPRTSVVQDGILSITNNSDGWEGWAMNAGPYWDAEMTLTFEIRMRQSGTSRVEIGKSNRQWSLVFTDNAVESRFGGDSVSLDTTQWRTYRITKTPGSPEDTVRLYIDDNPIPSGLNIEHAGTYDFNLLRIMKMAGGGTMEIDYIHYTASVDKAPGLMRHYVDGHYWPLHYQWHFPPNGMWPKWQASAANYGHTSVDNGILTLDGSSGTERWNIYADSGYWNAENNVTIEFRMRQISGESLVTFGQAENATRLHINASSIYDPFYGEGDSSVELDTTQWNVYRIVKTMDDEVSLFINNDPVAALDPNYINSTDVNMISFGSLSGGVSQWDFMRVSCIDAMPPVSDVPPSQCGGPGQAWLKQDINKDCVVDFRDFALLAANWLECNDPQCK